MEQPTIEELRTALKKYVESGLTNFVFLAPGTKADFYKFYHDLRTEQQPGENPHIQKFIDRRPGLGLVMGIGQQNFIALDFDKPALYERWKAANPDLAQTATNRTPQGFHILFRVSHLWGGFPNGIGPGVTLICNSWHVAVWPSYHPSGQRYEWVIPPWEELIEVKNSFEALGLEKIGIKETDFDFDVDEYGYPQGEWYCQECMQVDVCACGVNAWRWRPA